MQVYQQDSFILYSQGTQWIALIHASFSLKYIRVLQKT